eukprot:CAMPEP_0115522342 /NCGR_PEP_ID=MMETSP0271-20121206/80037_1 /TAXON_ID=71861 /ORGANISM="Scrippsiella trochoidea, Strain CCMP3099" /LENGTH=93 /DNA_ID=CAMNT_0002953651 /DNA_START=139 /DNA_END=416 /DNA_ORIENTATION=-
MASGSKQTLGSGIDLQRDCMARCATPLRFRPPLPLNLCSQRLDLLREIVEHLLAPLTLHLELLQLTLQRQAAGPVLLVLVGHCPLPSRCFGVA